MEPKDKAIRIVGIGECERCSFITIPPRDKRHPDHKDTALLCVDCAEQKCFQFE